VTTDSTDASGDAGGGGADSPPDVQRDLADMAASQAALTAWLGELTPVDPATPSLLPGWTVGHVLTHIARNADGALRQLDGLPQYWWGFTSRDADIELGATRSWAELVDDVAVTSAAVEARAAEVADWSGTTVSVVGPRPKALLAAGRQREVEVHRADLGLGYGFADMPTRLVREEVRRMTMAWSARQPMGLTALPEPVLRLPDHERLAWLWGRLAIDGVPPSGF
jgi:maleylpyruvate isomerase